MRHVEAELLGALSGEKVLDRDRNNVADKEPLRDGQPQFGIVRQVLEDFEIHLIDTDHAASETGKAYLRRFAARQGGDEIVRDKWDLEQRRAGSDLTRRDTLRYGQWRGQPQAGPEEDQGFSRDGGIVLRYQRKLFVSATEIAPVGRKLNAGRCPKCSSSNRFRFLGGRLRGR